MRRETKMNIKKLNMKVEYKRVFNSQCSMKDGVITNHKGCMLCGKEWHHVCKRCGILIHHKEDFPNCLGHFCSTNPKLCEQCFSDLKNK